MAAGQGTRMHSAVPKVLHEVCGRPMIAWPILAAREAGAGRVCVIVSPDHDLSSALPDGTETIVQPVADGTGGALRAAADVVSDSDTVLVLSGDTPLLGAEAIDALLAAHGDAGAAATMMTTELEDPGTFGRVIRGGDGEVERIVEAKKPGDASPEELQVREVNAGTYAFAAEPLADALGGLTNHNAQGEYYLPDVLPLIRKAGGRVIAHLVGDPAVNLGINDRADLARVTDEARRRILIAHMQAGVTIEDPGATWIDADVRIEPDATILPGTSLRGTTTVRIRQQHRADDHADRFPGGRARHRDPLLPDRLRGRRRGEGRAVHLPAPERPDRRGGQGRDLRRDQELRDRAGRQGPPSLLHRRRRGGGGNATSGRPP